MKYAYDTTVAQEGPTPARIASWSLTLRQWHSRLAPLFARPEVREHALLYLQAEHSVKGYFSNPRSRRGRQQGRVLASQYGEIVCDALYPGNTLLVQVLPDLITQAEAVLGLTLSKGAAPSSASMAAVARSARSTSCLNGVTPWSAKMTRCAAPTSSSST